jgi:pilus assembly protein CpaB
MSLRTALLAAIMLGLGGLGIVTWIGMQLPAKPPVVAAVAAPPPIKAQVLAAAHAVQAGSLLKYDDIQPREMLASEVPEGARADTAQTRAELAGSMIRRSLRPQEVLLPADLLRPGDHGFLAAVLRPGMRATAVGVDAVSGTAGLIWPGDHVDVLLTQVNDDQTVPAARRASAETVLGDIRVIAIDQQLMEGATGTGTEQTPTASSHTVTLEVTEAQAERVALAGRLGRLSLIVRAADAAPGAASDNPATTWGGDVSPALNQGHTAGRVMKIYHGTSDGKEFRF